MGESAISLNQALSLAAMGPCLFTIAFLLLACRPRLQAVIPSLFFVSLAAGFALPLLITSGYAQRTEWQLVLMALESLSPAMCYLLVLELIYRQPLPFSQWCIVAVPLLGGLPFVYGILFEQTVCVLGEFCTNTVLAGALYHVFTTAFIFLLLMAHISRSPVEALQQKPERRHTYWVIVTLITLHLMLPALELLQLSGGITLQKAELLSLLLRISFIYLVLTSLFRLYGSPVAVDSDAVPLLQKLGRPSFDDAALAQKLEAIMRHEAPYLQPTFSREELARLIRVSEQTASRILNQHLGKNFNEYVNDFRLEEAKRRLAKENGPINVIAYGVGFNSIASFNRVFKQSVGLSPSQYRQQYLPHLAQEALTEIPES
ncbi:MAG: helix-turn-helix transcriptional regulator [Rickettsiales bacterium]|nr:helix-turn-helix transcriptional regulator [Rickettsiales bacterium]